jgi:DNA invertase Pin-like site-specific DNA recombinase
MTVNKWIEETISGTKNAEDRKLGELLECLQKDDIMICSEISRLGRNILMIMSILNACTEKEAQVWTIKDSYRLSKDLSSKILAFAFGLTAEMERILISERTKEALARMKAEGTHIGRPCGAKSKEIKLTGKETLISELLEQKMPKSKIAEELGVHRTTLTRYLRNYYITLPNVY